MQNYPTIFTIEKHKIQNIHTVVPAKSDSDIIICLQL